ncbi:hypothetical protein [Hymenobacter jeongseonensis]|nr:hypothetical protein [Hymenobacter jeongseonensis]
MYLRDTNNVMSSTVGFRWTTVPTGIITNNNFTTPALGHPTAAWVNSWYSASSTVAEVAQFEGLDDAGTYELTVFGARNPVTGGNSKVTVNGVEKLITPSSPRTIAGNMALFTNLTPVGGIISYSWINTTAPNFYKNIVVLRKV